MIKLFKNSVLISIVLFICYVAILKNDAIENMETIKLIGNNFLIVLNVFLIILVVPVSLSLMDMVTGEFGLERFKRLAAISLGMTVLGFSLIQFISAITTSSAEGSTVIVEIIQQISHFTKSGTLKPYGLVGMLTSDASGPWNASIFPLLILLYWLVKKKTVSIESKQLHISMLIQFILYAQQFFFGLDLKYTLLEIILMLITGTIFVWGMLSFLIPMFKNAENASLKAEKEAREVIKINKKQSKIILFYKKIAHYFYKLLSNSPWKSKIDISDKNVRELNGGFGIVKKQHVFFDALQMTFIMTVSMFALVISMQFFAAQLTMSDAEAALFGTAGLTSLPEAFVVFKGGPYINALLLVGSNIIDGWMSSIGQTILLTYAEIFSGGTITSIPLHPAIAYLTFLSWTQGIFVWIILGLFAHKKKHSKKYTVLIIVFLIAAILYYFVGAWFSAQALGVGAEYAQESYIFKYLTSILEFLRRINAQEITLGASIIGFIILALKWSGLMDKFKSIIMSEPTKINDDYTKLKNEIYKKLGDQKQQVAIVLDKSFQMDSTGRIFTNKWIDLIFKETARVATILDDDEHVYVYKADDKTKRLNYMLTHKNANFYVEKYIGRKINANISYESVLKAIYNDYKGITDNHPPVLILFITSGKGEMTAELTRLLDKMSKISIFIEFLVVFGDIVPYEVTYLEDLPKKLKIKNMGVTLLPLYKFTDASIIVDEILEKFPKYLEERKKMMNNKKDATDEI